jgi:protein-S-isoprenylcysteine O-methyltransferase Ste14
VSKRAPILIGLGAASVFLLRRMRREFDSSDTLSKPTAVGMYATYVVHAALIVRVAHHRAVLLAFPPRLASAAGGALIVTGAALCVAGMRRFAGPSQITGTEVGELVTGGVYRYSRNPQYTGYILTLGGVGLGRRSALVLALAAAMALAYRWWVPVEERHLEREMGATYRHYRESTPRWLGMPSR